MPPVTAVRDALPRTALLRHDRRGHRPHFDWLVEWSPAGLLARTGIPTVRLPRRLDLLPASTVIDAAPIADHRALYLDLAGPRDLDGDRGRVTPRRRGEVLDAGLSGTTATLLVQWLASPRGTAPSWSVIEIDASDAPWRRAVVRARGLGSPGREVRLGVPSP